MAVLKDLIVHGSSRFLNAAYYNKIKADNVAAKEGIFNKIVATTGEISSLTVEDLTANRATVLSLLDVRGELHTNQWTNSNIATIDGSFYITPTIGIPEGTMTTTTNSVVVNGSNFPVSSLYVNNVNSDNAASTVAWTGNSKVLITGEILVNGVYMPLGTLVGVLDGDASATQIKIKSITDNRYQTAKSLAEIGTQSTALPCRNVKVSLYQTSRSSTLYPLGIFMTALGENGKTFLDIYGGGYSAATATAGGFAKPVLRIGNLAGLPTIGTQTPTGYGIYTSNGYFSGTVVAKEGIIGDGTAAWTIGNDGNNRSYIYSGITNITTTGSTAGTYVGTNGISNYASTTQYVNLTGGKITAQGADISGKITASSGAIAGWRIESTYLASGNATAPAANVLLLSPSGTSSSYTIAGQAKTGWMITAGTTFGVNKDGGVYATSGKIGGFDIGTSNIRNGNITGANNTSVAGVYLGTDGLNISGGSAASTAYIYKNGSSLSVNIGNKLTWNGSTLTIDGAASIGGTTASTIVSNASAGASAKTAIDNLEIGGRNLLLSTANMRNNKHTASPTPEFIDDYVKITATSKSWYDFMLSTKCRGLDLIKAAQSLALSLDVKMENAGEGALYVEIITVSNDNLGARVKTSSSTIYINSNFPTEWTRVKGIANTDRSTWVKHNENTEIGITAHIYWYNTGTLYFRKPKLEIGNKATDWTPAPEDVDSNILSKGVEYIVGTQTATTNVWTGVSIDDSIYAGKTIAYYLPFAGNSSAATLNLTLANGTTTGAKNVRINNSNVTTHYSQYSVINLTYDGTYWKADNYNSDTYNRIRYQAVISAADTITNSRIICGTASGYKNIGASVSFDLAYPLLYAGTTIAAGATDGTRDNNYLEINSITYSNNGTITSGAANKTIYLKGTVVGNIFTISTSPFLTTVISNSEDGYCYIPLGIMTSTTVGYFKSTSELWTYKDGSFGPVSLREASAAAKTATNYIAYIDSTNGIKIALANPSSVSSNYIQITNSDIKIIRDNTHKTTIDSNGMKVYAGDASNPVAQFGATIIIGNQSKSYATITPNAFKMTYDDDYVVFEDMRDSNGLAERNEYIEIVVDDNTSTATTSNSINSIVELEIHETQVGNGSTKAFTAKNTIASVDVIVVDGVVQNTSAYTISNNTITFTTAPANEAIITLNYYITTVNYSNNIITLGSGTNGAISVKYKTRDRVRNFILGTDNGFNAYDFGDGSLVLGGSFSMTQGSTKYRSGLNTIAHGDRVIAQGENSFAHGRISKAIGQHSFASGNFCEAIGYCCHAEGNSTIARMSHAHAEGNRTKAIAPDSHAEGYMTTAYGESSHAEAWETEANGDASHAEGYLTLANGNASHAEGEKTIASGYASHTQNYYTVATENYQTVIGKYNSATRSGSGTTSSPYTYSNAGNYAFIIGNGSGDATSSRSNALTVDWSGNVNIASGAKYKINGTALSASDVGAVPTSDVSTSGGANKVVKTDSSGNVNIASGASYKVNGTSLLELVYPVGAIYISTVSTSPATLFGFGTWTRISGQFLLGATDNGSTGSSVNSTASAAAGASGGEATVTLSGAQSGIQAHSHTAATSSDWFLTTTGEGLTRHTVASGSGAANMVRAPGAIERKSTTGTVTAKDATSAHNNMPPFLSVYMWKRTA